MHSTSFCWNWQVQSYQNSGIKLGIFKAFNESLTRIAVYLSLMALYCLGGSKVKAVRTWLKAMYSSSWYYILVSLIILPTLKDFPVIIYLINFRMTPSDYHTCGYWQAFIFLTATHLFHVGWALSWNCGFLYWIHIYADFCCKFLPGTPFFFFFFGSCLLHNVLISSILGSRAG